MSAADELMALIGFAELLRATGALDQAHNQWLGQAVDRINNVCNIRRKATSGDISQEVAELRAMMVQQLAGEEIAALRAQIQGLQAERTSLKLKLAATGFANEAWQRVCDALRTQLAAVTPDAAVREAMLRIVQELYEWDDIDAQNKDRVLVNDWLDSLPPLEEEEEGENGQ
jgi:hypothetical protein